MKVNTHPQPRDKGNKIVKGMTTRKDEQWEINELTGRANEVMVGVDQEREKGGGGGCITVERLENNRKFSMMGSRFGGSENPKSQRGTDIPGLQASKPVLPRYLNKKKTEE